MLAICISGALRNFEEVWPTNEKIFRETGIPFKIFMHTWTQDFSTTRRVHRDINWHGFTMALKPKKYKEYGGTVLFSKIKDVIPLSTLSMEDFNEDEICSEFKIPHRDKTQLYQSLLNSTAMYIGMSKCFNMATIDPEFHKFTHFARVRTDFLLKKSIPAEVFLSDLYFGGPGVETRTGYVSDQFFIMKKHFIPVVCELPRFIKNHVIDNGWQLDSMNTFYAERILSAAFQNSRSQCDIVIEPIIGEIKRPVILSNAEMSQIFHLKDMFRHNLIIAKRQLKKLLKKLFL
jgi:hypothetical protein